MRKILFSIALSSSFFLSTTVFAITLNLYENPDTSSKLVTTIKSGDQLLPFFYTPTKDWVKVAIPQNGQVGWIKISDLKVIKKANSSSQQNNNTQPLPYTTPQVSNPGNLKQQDIDQIRNSLQNLHTILKDFAQDFYTIPITQPIIVVPYSSNGDKAGTNNL